VPLRAAPRDLVSEPARIAHNEMSHDRRCPIYHQRGKDTARNSAGIPVGFTPYNISNSGGALSALIEITLGIRFRLSENLGLRLGYQPVLPHHRTGLGSAAAWQLRPRRQCWHGWAFGWPAGDVVKSRESLQIWVGLVKFAAHAADTIRRADLFASSCRLDHSVDKSCGVFLMSSTIAFCAIVIAGWGSPELGESVSAPRDDLRPQRLGPQQSNPQSAMPRSDRLMNEGVMRPQRMPLPPTDPRAFVGDNLPLPPTMNDAGTLPGAGKVGSGLRHDLTGLAENGDHRFPSAKAFEHYRPAPAVSPYQLINSNTSDGTISPYMAYVRPAQDQQRANQELDRMGDAVDQPAPAYPRVFQNYGSYYPSYSGR
jgi:hypothetical protein